MALCVRVLHTASVPCPLDGVRALSVPRARDMHALRTMVAACVYCVRELQTRNLRACTACVCFVSCKRVYCVYCVRVLRVLRALRVLLLCAS